MSLLTTKYKILSREEENEIVKEIQSGNCSRQGVLMESLLGTIIVPSVLRYARAKNNHRHNEDMVMCGAEWVYHAVKGYRHAGPASFRTYAWSFVKRGMQLEYIRLTSGFFLHINSLKRKIKNGNKASVKNVDDLSHHADPKSLTTEDRIVDQLDEGKLIALAMRVCDRLGKKHKNSDPEVLKFLIKSRFGLDNSEEMTFEEIGRHLGISKQAVEVKLKCILKHIKPQYEEAWLCSNQYCPN